MTNNTALIPSGQGAALDADPKVRNKRLVYRRVKRRAASLCAAFPAPIRLAQVVARASRVLALTGISAHDLCRFDRKGLQPGSWSPTMTVTKSPARQALLARLTEVQNQQIILSKKQDTILTKLYEIEERLCAHAKAQELRGLEGASPFLTTSEAAEIAKRTPETIRDWISSGILSGTRRPGSGPRSPLLVRRDELVALLLSADDEGEATLDSLQIAERST